MTLCVSNDEFLFLFSRGRKKFFFFTIDRGSWILYIISFFESFVNFHLLIIHRSKNRTQRKAWRFAPRSKESRSNECKLFLSLRKTPSPFSRNTDPFKILSSFSGPPPPPSPSPGSAQLKYGRSRATLSAGQINVTKGQINAAASNEGEANSVGIN